MEAASEDACVWHRTPYAYSIALHRLAFCRAFSPADTKHQHNAAKGQDRSAGASGGGAQGSHNNLHFPPPIGPRPAEGAAWMRGTTLTDKIRSRHTSSPRVECEIRRRDSDRDDTKRKKERMVQRRA